MSPVFRFALLSGVLVSLAACATGPEVDRNAVSQMQQKLAKPYYVNVSNIIVDNKYNPLANAKDISSTLPTPQEALPGRDTPGPLADRHAVLGTPMAGPYADGRYFIGDQEVLRLVRSVVPDDFVVISAGGVETAEDVRERLSVGANLVQGYTAFLYRGPLWARQINRGLV